VLAAALLAGAGAANATIANTVGLNNDLFLEVYDPNAVNADLSKGRTYNLDLKVTLAAIQTNAASALAAEVAGLNLSTDAKWATFAGGITNPSAVQYLVAVGAGTGSGQTIAITGINAIQPNVDPTITLAPAGDQIQKQAGYINANLTSTTNSSLVQNNAPILTGQMNNTGLLASTIWTGWSTHNPLQTYGSSVGFWLGGVHTAMVVDPVLYSIFYDPTAGAVNDPALWTIPQDQFTASDVSKLGTFTLAGNTLTFAAPAVAAVPLPAAVWLFGAGLMGVLRLNRRKSA
jgi:hypothetical protein